MTVTIYRSTDGGAPSLFGGVAGSLLDVLDFALLPSGWTKPFSAGSVAVYREPSPGSNGFYMRVDDSGTSPDTRQALVTGYETMSAISTGTNPFPDPNYNQTAGTTCYIRKANTTVGVRNWVVIVWNGIHPITLQPLSRFYLWIQTNLVSNEIITPGSGDCGVYAFGDFVTYKPITDPYSTLIQMGTSTGVTSFIPCTESNFISGGAGILSFAPREWSGLGSSIPFATPTSDPMFVFDGNANFANYFANTHISGGGGLPYPYPLNNGLIITRPLIVRRHSNNRYTYGFVPGIWWVAHKGAPTNPSLAHANTFSGTGSLAGRTFELFNYTTTPGVVAIETSDTWET